MVLYDGNDDNKDDALYAVHRYLSMDFMCINECDSVNVMNLMSNAHCSRPIPSRTFCEIQLAMLFVKFLFAHFLAIVDLAYY